MNRTRALAIVLLATGALALGVAVWRWPSTAPALDCPNGEVTLDDAGVAHCGPGTPLPAGQSLTIGKKLDLNRVTADELALVPGVGPQLAKALIDERARLGEFSSWEQVDAVSGVGASRLEALQRVCVLGGADGGL